jgi:hypothetical protein
MASTEIVWRTPMGDLMGVGVDSPEAGDDRVRLSIGPRSFLRLPRTEARLLAKALLDAANSPVRAAPRKNIPNHAAPPAPLYHEPEEETHV